MKGTVYGKGINDSCRPVSKKTYKNGVMTSSWICPKYEMWKGMLRRCLDTNFKSKNQRYAMCEVDNRWLIFSNFEQWLGNSNLKGMEVDKDLIFDGNKIYSQDLCFLVPSRINSLLCSTPKTRGLYPVGVHEKRGRYYAQISDQFNNKQRSLGYHHTPLSAHASWQDAKVAHIRSTVDWWMTSDEFASTFIQKCGDKLLDIANKIEDDRLNQRETVMK